MANAPPTADDRGTTARGTLSLVLAVLSVLLGATSLALLGNLVAAVPALLLGFVSFRWINRSDGRFRGRWLALAGMVLGAVGTAIGAAGHLSMALVRLRAEAERAQCEYNLAQIGVAVNLYHDHQQPAAYPPLVLPSPALPADRPEQHLSWLAGLLPYLEATAEQAGTARTPPQRVVRARQTNERLDRARAWDADENREAVDTVLPQYLCPGNAPRAARGTPGLTSYVGLAGVGPDAAALPASDPRAGFFGYRRVLSRDDLVPAAPGGGGRPEARGTSHILLALETADANGPWAAGGPATVRGLDPARRPYTGPGRPFGGCHPGGFNALFVDGSVTFFKDSYAPEKLETLALLKTAREP